MSICYNNDNHALIHQDQAQVTVVLDRLIHNEPATLGRVHAPVIRVQDLDSIGQCKALVAQLESKKQWT